ncbi:MAG: hypothetical protein QM758_19425 [Armatimonas sp.]
MSSTTPSSDAPLSLEQLRKQAKERLKAHRLTSSKPLKLADAQRTLAQEHGFPNWPALVQHARANPAEAAIYHALSEALTEAYTTGNIDIIRNLNWVHGTAFPWERNVDKMQSWLPSWYSTTERAPELALTDARKLVARQSGFETWEALIQSLTPARKVKERHTPFVRYDASNNQLHIQGVLAPPHWEAVIDLARQTGATGIHAGYITDSALAQLSELEHLTALNFDGAGVLTDEGLQHLARFSQLEKLDLSSPRSQLTDSGMAMLGQLSKLRELKLCWVPQITDVGMAAISSCKHLERVNLMGTYTGDGTVRALAGHANLHNLIVGRSLTDVGLLLLHDLPQFRQAHAGIQPELLLDGPVTNTGLHALAGLDGLYQLGFFWHTPALTSAGLAALAALPQLQALACEGELCDDTAMAYIAAIPNLRRLQAQGTVATDAGFQALSKSQSLESLWGRECPNLTGLGFAAIVAMPRLQDIGVSCKQVDDDSLASLPDFPALRKFVSIDVSDSGFRHVGRCEQLEELSCMYCRETTDAATEHLTGLANLRTYYAGMTRITDRSLEVLAQLDTLESLHFWQVADITDAGVTGLARLPKLKKLVVEGSAEVSHSVGDAFPARVKVEISG